MLRPLHDIKRYTLAARDGEIGRVKDFLFDEEQWTVRYMVADTGKWIPKRKILISPVSLGKPDWDSKTFDVHLTKEQVEHQPDLDSDAPVSRRYEKKWFETYEYPYYWQGTNYLWGYGMAPTSLHDRPATREKVPESLEIDEECVLRSLEEIRNYRVLANDGEMGHVEDLVMDDETWAIRYIMVDLHDWIPGRKVILAPGWFERFDWRKETLDCTLSRDAVKSSPPFNPLEPIKRGYEQDLHSFYNVVPYWKV
jgi:sporulation protein YlmC with PRC-barrel domain